ncbi:VOC family protein [Thioalkalivibrio sp. ALE16]|uniref:VOC family protein n=1 Tax=Thioalkalivibrio sp. ALE16 TaxID=1158172 RepID=UPI0003707067|nr:VOC family protein [Thioalkalivibrio sp. ALE16]
MTGAGRGNAGVLGLHHASLVIADIQAAREFYGHHLGLAPLERPELGFPGLWYDLGNGQALHLLRVPNPDPTERAVRCGQDRHLALRVDELETFAARLEAAGFAVERSRSGRPAAFVRDPDGNAIELIEDGA